MVIQYLEKIIMINILSHQKSASRRYIGICLTPLRMWLAANAGGSTGNRLLTYCSQEGKLLEKAVWGAP